MAYLGHTVMENRNGLIVGARISHATGTAERDIAVELLATLPSEHSKTLGADKNYDTADFIAQCSASTTLAGSASINLAGFTELMTSAVRQTSSFDNFRLRTE